MQPNVDPASAHTEGPRANRRSGSGGAVPAAGPVAVAAGAVLGAVAVRVNPPERLGSWGWCPWLVLTGRPCPTCGGLRAGSALMQGDLPTAWAANAYLSATVLLAALVWLAWLTDSLRPLRPARSAGPAPAGPPARPVWRGRAGRLAPVLLLAWSGGLVGFGAVRWVVSPTWFIG